MKKTIYIFLILILSLSACEKKEDAPQNEVVSGQQVENDQKALSSVYDDIKSSAQNELTVINEEAVGDKFDVDTTKAEEFIFALAGGESAEMIVLVKSNDLDYFEEKIKEYTEKKAAEFDSYGPEQAELLRNVNLNKKGEYIICAVSENAEEICEKAFEALAV